jgi:type IV conjugative transfer system coupling protein TraD
MSFKNLTQGGQVTLHNIRMFRQVFTVTLLITLISGIIFWGVKSYHDFTPYQRYVIGSAWLANIKLSISGNKNKETQDFRYANGWEEAILCLHIKNNKSIQLWVKEFEKRAWHNAILSCWFMSGLFILICGFWIWRGKVKQIKKILSGLTIVPPKTLKKMLKKDKSQFHIGGIPLRKDCETQHLLVCGTTGTGKSTCFFELLPQIRAAKQRCIIVDTTGEFVARYYRDKQDILINPFDDRTLGWNPWVDCSHPYHYDELASIFIPQTGSDKFWSDAARTVFSETLKLQAKLNNFDTEYMLRMLLTVPLKELFRHLEETLAASLVDPAGDRTAMSIRAHLSSYLKSLEFLPKDRPMFSIRKWVQEDHEEQDQWVFLTATPDQRETLRPLLTALTGSAVNALMSCKPDHNRRLWIHIDEFASLQKQEAFAKALAEFRKFGGCIAVGLQDIPQLRALYGHAEAESMVSLFNTRVIFRSGHPDTAKVMSQMLGEQEIREAVTGISYGAHQMRDGVSLNDQNKMRPVVTTTDLMSLENREAYLKLPGNLPITKIKFEIPRCELMSPHFIPIQDCKPPKEHTSESQALQTSVLEKADLSSSQIIQQIDEDPNNQITTMDLSTNDVPTDRKKGGAK